MGGGRKIVETVATPCRRRCCRDSPGRLIPSRIVRSIVASLSADEPFGPTLVASETNRQYAGTLRRPLDTRTISDILRRMRDKGLLHLVQGGKAFHEALYAKGPRKRA